VWVIRIAKWDSSSWSALGAGMNGSVRALAVDGSGHLNAGGLFSQAGGVTVNRIAKWDGSDWSALGTGMSGTVRALAVDAGGNLFAGGHFTTAGGVAVNRIATWDGSNWSALGSGVNSWVGALVVGDPGNLYAGGDFTMAGGKVSGRVALWHAPADATVTLHNLSQVYDGTPRMVTATTDPTNLTVSISYDGLPTAPTNAGSYAVVAEVDDPIWTGSATGTLEVAAAEQAITFATIADQVITNTVILSATADSGLPVVFAVASGPAILEGTILSFTGAGTVSVVASQDGDANWNAAQPVERAFEVSSPFPPEIVTPPQPVAVTRGDVAAFVVYAESVEPVSYQWFKNGEAIDGATNAALSIASVSFEDAGYYAVEVSNVYGVSLSNEVGLHVNGVRAGDLEYDFLRTYGADGRIDTLALQPDGRIIIGGVFSHVDGVPRGRLARLHQDGSLDHSFGHEMTGANFSVSTVALQPDGRMIAAGNFTTFNGATVGRIVRLHRDGSLDESFGSGQSGANSSISALALQSDGKILIGGWFTTFNGVSRSRIARLHADGTLDESFSTAANDVNDRVQTIHIQTDGRIMIGGAFSTVGDQTRAGVARLFGDGSLDETFGNGLPTMTPIVSVIAQQSDGRYIVGGRHTGWDEIQRCLIVRFHQDGSFDDSFQSDSPGAEGTVTDLLVLPNDDLLVVGTFTEMRGFERSRIARLHADGSFDSSFGIEGGGAGDSVSALALRPDGDVVIGGHFTSVDGISRGYTALLGLDGSLDISFSGVMAGARFPRVHAIAVQPDGRILVSGSFTSFNGLSRGRVARLFPDGTLDQTFGDGLRGAENPSLEGTANVTVNSLALQSDGKILIGGDFTAVNGVARGRIARLHGDGTLDESFGDGLSGANGSVRTIVVQPDGRILIGGLFSQINSSSQAGMARLHEDGSWDSSFSVTIVREWSGNSLGVYSIVPQPDGKLLVGGWFTTVNGVARGHIARLHADGSLDENFGDGLAGASSSVSAVVLQPDGKAVVGGGFVQMHGVALGRIARLHSDGTLDTDFGHGLEGANAFVRQLALDDSGRILVAGAFTSVHGEPRSRIARLHPDGALDEDFADELVLHSPFHTFDGIMAVALDEDGDIFVGGDFDSVNNTARQGLAKLSSKSDYVLFGLYGLDMTVVENESIPSLETGTDFGAVLVDIDVVTHVFTVTNTGHIPLDITSISASGPGADSFAVLDAPDEVEVGASETLTIQFTPQVGQQDATFTIIHNGVDSPFILHVRGVGEIGRIGLDQDALLFTGMFADVNAPNQSTVLTNMGTAAFTWTGDITYSAGASGWLTVSPDHGTLVASESVTLTNAVDLTNLDAGTYWATNRITSADVTNSPQHVVVQLIVSPGEQTIDFPELPLQITTNTVALTATASSGLPVAFAVSSGPAVLDGTNLTFTGAGTVSVVASQDGDGNWNAAVPVTNTFEVVKSDAMVMLHNLSQVYDGTPRVVTATTDPTNLTVTISYDGLPTAPTNAGSYAVIASIADTEAMWTGSVTGTLEVAQADQVIIFPSIPDQVTTNTVALSATADSGLPVSFVLESGPAVLEGTVLSFTGAGTVSVVASQEGDANWNAAPAVTNTFEVSKTPATVELDDLAQTYDGTARAVTVTTDPMGLDVVVTYDGAVVAPTNAGSYEVIASIAGTETMWAGSVTGTLEVAQADQVIDFPSIPAQVTTNTVALSATADSGLPVSIAVESGLADLTDGTNLTFTGAGMVSVVASQEGDANWNAAPAVTNTFAVLGIYSLAVVSEHGSVEPAVGEHFYLEGMLITNQVFSPLTMGSTQYVATGWVLIDDEPSYVEGTNLVLAITNNTVLTWQWATNYWLTADAGTNGTVDVTAGWYAAASIVSITALPDTNHVFAGWVGDASGDENPLLLGMDGPRSVTALFTPIQTPLENDVASWADELGIEAESRGLNDRNGPMLWPNVLAYAMGVNPFTATMDDVPSLGAYDAEQNRIPFEYLRDPDAAGVDLRVMITDVLGGDWTEADVVSETIVTEPDGRERVVAQIQLPAGTTHFVRLVAMEAD